MIFIMVVCFLLIIFAVQQISIIKDNFVKGALCFCAGYLGIYVAIKSLKWNYDVNMEDKK